MRSATKVLLETIQVGRHVSRIALRPMEKGALHLAKSTEEFAFWALRLQPLEDVLGKQRVSHIEDSYLQAKEVVVEYVASLSHQSWKSALQSSAQTATLLMRSANIQGKVIGPLDEHWNTLKVIRDIKSAEEERSERGIGAGEAMRLTPKRFVKFMREAERRKRRTQGRDPIDGYVEWLLSSGSLSRMGPMILEKKLYTDVARIICFAFDQALMEANGTDIWGHELHVHVIKEDERAGRIARRTYVGTEQIEVVVDRMLRSQDLRVPVPMQGFQRQLITNCSLMILQLIEDLTSDRNMQVRMLGHNLRIRLEPLAMTKLMEQEDKEEGSFSRRFKVNKKAIDELVDALIEEPEIQLVLVPDLLEAEAYRYALHRTICIAQFILSELRIRLFGVEVRLNLVAQEDEEQGTEGHGVDRVHEVRVTADELDMIVDRIVDERRKVKMELRSRDDEDVSQAWKGKPRDEPANVEDDQVLTSDQHEFQTLAAQDRLSRSLSIQRTITVPIDLAFKMVSDFNEYPKWMPFCTDAKVLGGDDKRMRCEVGFGFETGTVLGSVGDAVRYQVLLRPPDTPTESATGLRTARVVADTTELGFRYGKRLVYDWRFTEVAEGETDVSLDMFFQAKNVFFLPLWDSMQATITGVMMKKFIERAATLTDTSVAEVVSAGEKKRRDDSNKAAAVGGPAAATDAPPVAVEEAADAKATPAAAVVASADDNVAPAAAAAAAAAAATATTRQRRFPDPRRSGGAQCNDNDATAPKPT